MYKGGRPGAAGWMCRMPLAVRHRLLLALVCLFYGGAGSTVSAQIPLPLPLAGQEQPEFQTPGLSSPGSPEVVAAEAEPATIDESNRVFGDFLFTGQFAAQSFIGFNPSYEVAVGDKIALRLWGGFDFEGELVVDAQGNIFIPNVGPVAVQSVRNEDLNKIVTDAIKNVYTRNVGVYASLGGAEPVKVFVTGFVNQPGLYAGHASDSVLFFLDRAGGIDARRGSYLKIEVLRGGGMHQSVNLYDFVLKGQLPVFQIADGDTIVVNQVGSQAGVFGDVQNPFLYEFSGSATTVGALLDMARPLPQATHVRISRNSRVKREVEYLPIADARPVSLMGGDVIDVTSDKIPGTISVRVEGEHTSAQEFVLPYGASLGDLLERVRFGENAQADAIRLLRLSVKERQKEMLEAQLRALESSVLTARSRTREEAQLRTQEADLILRWVDRARKIEPQGQVSLAGSSSRDDILLESGDVIRIPRQSNLVIIHGDVLFPAAVAYQPGNSVQAYIDQAGGFTQSRHVANVLILHRDGTFTRVPSRQLKSSRLSLEPGDEIFVLPKVDSKNLQIVKDITQIFYQLALSAGVVLRL